MIGSSAPSVSILIALPGWSLTHCALEDTGLREILAQLGRQLRDRLDRDVPGIRRDVTSLSDWARTVPPLLVPQSQKMNAACL
jgi:hypothetical protein